MEWPAILRAAPVPSTVSRPAREALRSIAHQREACELGEQREACARVQVALGARQRERYQVTMVDDVIANIPVRRFTPAESASDAPILLNFHGGGFTKDAGSVTENVPIAALTGMTVIAVRYRLAPEHPFPAAVDDAEAVYRALLTDRTPKQIGVYGTSAGAILAAQLMVRLQSKNEPLPGALGFFTGTADLSRSGDTEHFFRPESDSARSGSLFAPYIGARDPKSPSISPLFAELSGFPPTLCIAGTRDFLLSQTTMFHRALLQAGVAAELVVFEAMLHAHWIYLELPESDEAFHLMANFLCRRLIDERAPADGICTCSGNV